MKPDTVTQYSTVIPSYQVLIFAFTPARNLVAKDEESAENDLYLKSHRHALVVLICIYMTEQWELAKT